MESPSPPWRQPPSVVPVLFDHWTTAKAEGTVTHDRATCAVHDLPIGSSLECELDKARGLRETSGRSRNSGTSARICRRATVQEKGKDIHVAVVISDNTGLAAAKILLHREAYSKNERNPNAAGKPEVSSMTGLPPCLKGGAILHIRHGISSS